MHHALLFPCRRLLSPSPSPLVSPLFSSSISMAMVFSLAYHDSPMPDGYLTAGGSDLGIRVKGGDDSGGGAHKDFLGMRIKEGGGGGGWRGPHNYFVGTSVEGAGGVANNALGMRIEGGGGVHNNTLGTSGEAGGCSGFCDNALGMHIQRGAGRGCNNTLGMHIEEGGPRYDTLGMHIKEGGPHYNTLGMHIKEGRSPLYSTLGTHIADGDGAVRITGLGMRSEECEPRNNARCLSDLIAPELAPPSLTSSNIAISALARLGRLEEARATFDSIPPEKKNTSSWNAMLSAYTHNGHVPEARLLFDTMPERDPVSWNTMIAAYGNSCLLHEAKYLFDRSPRHDVVAWNAMVTAYARVGQIESARVMFEEMPKRDVVSWTAIITAYARSGHSKRALELFRQMESEGEKPNKVTFVSVLGACLCLDDGKQIHASVCRGGLESEVAISTALVNMYGKCGSLEDANNTFRKIADPNVVSWNSMISAYSQNGCLENARSVFDEAPNRNVVSWNAMIAGYSQNGQANEALELFRRMELEGVIPDKVTFVSVLDACAGWMSIHQGKRIHAYIAAEGLEIDVVLGTSLINMYGKCGILNVARVLFEGMLKRNIVSWNTMLTAYVQNEQSVSALEFFQRMFVNGVKPDNITFSSLLDACANLEAIEEGKKAHAIIFCVGLDSDVAVGNALVNMYGKCGNLRDAWSVFNGLPERDVISWNAIIAACAKNGCLEDARTVFDRMPDRNIISWTCMIAAYSQEGCVEDARQLFDIMPYRNVVSWTAMITAYAQNGQCTAALEMFQQMGLEGVEANKITFLSIIDACSILGTPGNGKMIHASLVKVGCESDLVLGNSLIKMYGRCKSVEGAVRLFEKMLMRDVVSWNALIAAHTKNGQGMGALELFFRMQRIGLKPDNITFISVLDACAIMAALRLGKMIHASIAHVGGRGLDVGVWNSLINMYGKCGYLSEARAVFDKMSERDVVTWNTLIAAHAQNGEGKGALDLFRLMKPQGINANKITFISFLSACSHAGLLEEGRKSFSLMYRDHKIVPSVEHYVCMVDLLGRAGDFDEVEGLFRTIPFEPPFEPLAASWLCMLGACRNCGAVEQGAWAASHFAEFDLKNAVLPQGKIDE